MDPLDTLLTIALDLTAAMNAKDRYRRLLEAVRKAIPCDAAALLRLDGDVLIPVAAYGLRPEALGRRYVRREHPRLDIVCSAPEPVRFPPDTQIPDPFDGLLDSDSSALERVHACLGCPLRVGDELVGALTADALDEHAFDGLEQRLLTALGALAGAAIRTSELIETLEDTAQRQGMIARELMRGSRAGSQVNLIGASALMDRLRDEIALVARSEFTVLVLGETGVGKELVVRAIHEKSTRAQGALIQVNCASLPESLVESELFGHVRGAFTGASSDRAGKFEVADGGTLFLDEVGELPLPGQAKLLRALQEGEIQRVGSDKLHTVDVRVIAATNRDLEAEVGAGRFRADLYHRLAVYPLRVPPLRERVEDIAPLGGHFCDQTRRQLGVGPVRLSAAAQDALARYNWPGNVRELENVLARAGLRASSDAPQGEPVIIRPVHLGVEFGAETEPSGPSRSRNTGSLQYPISLNEAVDDFKREAIRQAVERKGGNWAAAARDLTMHRSNLYALAKRLGLR